MTAIRKRSDRIEVLTFVTWRAPGLVSSDGDDGLSDVSAITSLGRVR